MNLHGSITILPSLSTTDGMIRSPQTKVNIISIYVRSNCPFRILLGIQEILKTCYAPGPGSRVVNKPDKIFAFEGLTF